MELQKRFTCGRTAVYKSGSSSTRNNLLPRTDASYRDILTNEFLTELCLFRTLPWSEQQLLVLSSLQELIFVSLFVEVYYFNILLQNFWSAANCSVWIMKASRYETLLHRLRLSLMFGGYYWKNKPICKLLQVSKTNDIYMQCCWARTRHKTNRVSKQGLLQDATAHSWPLEQLCSAWQWCCKV